MYIIMTDVSSKMEIFIQKKRYKRDEVYCNVYITSSQCELFVMEILTE